VILNNEKLLFNTNTQQTTNRQTMALETVPSCAIDEEILSFFLSLILECNKVCNTTEKLLQHKKISSQNSIKEKSRNTIE
jgi:hypothetical protein